MKRRHLPLYVLASIPLFAGCGGSESSLGGAAQFRVINAVSNSDPVDFRYRNALFADDLSFGSGFPASNQDPEILTAGAGTLQVYDSSGVTQLLSSSATLAGDAVGAAIFAGRIGTGSDSARVLVVADLRSSLTFDSASIRLTHATLAAGTVDIYVTEASVTTLTGLTPTLNDVARYATGAIVTVPSGNYRVWVTASTNQAALLNRTVTVNAGRYYNYVLVDGPGTTADMLEFRTAL